MEFNTINYEIDGGIGLITLNRPKSMNALNDELIREMNNIFSNIADDKDIFAVIITGGKTVFAAGGDIKEICKIRTPLEAHRFIAKIQLLFDRIEKLPQPVIAAVGGPALGGGCELCLACDIRIVAENAVFGQPQIKIGVIPGGGGTQRLPRLVGLGRAKELLYTGDFIDAREAYRIGLANKVVPVDMLMDETKKLADKMIEKPAFAMKITKMVVNEGQNMDLKSALAHEARCFEILFSTEDQKEGMAAFIEKRKPEFTGK